MRFLDIILENSPVKQAKLAGPAAKCAEKPDNGVTIVNPAAYHVIKDCALIASKYLPHHIFGLYANPLEELKGKFNYQNVKEFVDAAYSDIVLNQLLILILDKIKRSPGAIPVNANDPYGDYESYESNVREKDTVNLVCQAFSVPILK